jgi:hypothetical protein
MSIEHIEGLDKDAWERWVAYRKAIRKPLKDVSLHAAALKLSKYGADQAEVVNQSVSNQWQGLFELRKGKADPTEPKQKTDKQKAADQQIFEINEGKSQKYWDSVEGNPISMLRLCDALLARYTQRAGDPDIPERIQWLKGRVGDFIRQADPKEVLGDPHIKSMVWHLFGERGIARLSGGGATPQTVQ